MNTNRTVRNRILSLALALCLALGMTLYLPGPVEVSADIGIEDGSPSSVTVGKAATPAPDSSAGGPDAADVTVLAFGGQEWYVIGYKGDGVYSSGNTMTLLAKESISDSYFGKTTFPYSGYDGNDLQSAISAVHTVMDNREQGMIEKRDLDDTYDSDTEYDGSNTPITNQPLWPLSYDEAMEVSYSVRNVNRSHYHYHYWWLRSPTVVFPGGEMTYVTYVSNGVVRDDGTLADANSMGVRPAFRLDLSSVLFTSDASGKPNSLATAFLSAAEPPTGAIKFTMEDEGQTLNVTATTQQATQTDGALAFGYQNATTGARQWVSCFLENQGSGKDYYGKLVDASNGSAKNGNLSIPLSGVDDGDYTLYIFSEQENGGNHTDFASKPVTMSVRVSTGNGTVSNFDGDVLSDDADLLKVAGKTITTIKGDGNIGTPYTAAITLGYSWSSITDGDLDAAPGATAALYDNTYSTRQSPVNLAVGDNSLYVKVTAEDRIEEQYYHITATRDIEPKEPYVARNTLSLAEGETIALTISLGRGDSAAHSATITSEDHGVSTVNPARLEQSDDVSVTGVAAGKTTLTIGYSGGSRHGDFDTVQVTVTDGNTGGSSGTRSSSSSSGGSSTPDSRVAKTQLPANAFTWDGRTLTINHDNIPPLGLQSVRWDNVPLTRGTDFGVYSGSVIIRFGEEFIAAQSAGEHTIKVEFLNHTGEATVTVGQAEPTASGAGDDNNHNPDTGGYPDGSYPGTDNPNTGDSGGIWPALLLGSLGGIVIVVRRLKPVA